MLSLPHGMMDIGIMMVHLNITRVNLQYGGYACLANNSWPMARAVNVEEPRVKDYHDEVDDCELEGGRGDMGFDPSDYEGIEELPSVVSTSSLLPPHVKAAWIAYHYKQQEQ